MDFQAVEESDEEQFAYPQATSAITRPQLTASSASAIFLSYLVVQAGSALAVGMSAAAVGGILASLNGKNVRDPRVLSGIVLQSQSLSVTAGIVFGAIAMIILSVRFVPSALKSAEPTGAAWRVGSARMLGVGLVVGITISVFNVLWSLLMRFALMTATATPLTAATPLVAMGMTRGPSQIMFAMIALLFAPITEELLFRGILYGGFRKSFGPITAAVFVTAMFVICHYYTLKAFPPAALGLALLASASLWLRLRTGSLGPSIAAHTAFNFLPVLITAIVTATN